MFIATCHPNCKKLKVYAPMKKDRKDDLYEIDGVFGTRAEFRKLFRMAGIIR